MESVFEPDVLKLIQHHVNGTSVKIVQTQYGGHLLYKAMVDVEHVTKAHLENVSNGYAVKIKNDFVDNALNSNSWKYLYTT